MGLSPRLEKEVFPGRCKYESENVRFDDMLDSLGVGYPETQYWFEVQVGGILVYCRCILRCVRSTPR